MAQITKNNPKRLQEGENKNKVDNCFLFGEELNLAVKIAISETVILA